MTNPGAWVDNDCAVELDEGLDHDFHGLDHAFPGRADALPSDPMGSGEPMAEKTPEDPARDFLRENSVFGGDLHVARQSRAIADLYRQGRIEESRAMAKAMLQDIAHRRAQERAAKNTPVEVVRRPRGRPRKHPR